MWSTIATWFMNYIWKRLASWASAIFRNNKKVKAQNQEAEEKAAKYEEAVKDPAKQSREERRRAEDDFLNR